MLGNLTILTLFFKGIISLSNFLIILFSLSFDLFCNFFLSLFLKIKSFEKSLSIYFFIWLSYGVVSFVFISDDLNISNSFLIKLSLFKNVLYGFSIWFFLSMESSLFFLFNKNEFFIFDNKLDSCSFNISSTFDILNFIKSFISSIFLLIFSKSDLYLSFIRLIFSIFFSYSSLLKSNCFKSSSFIDNILLFNSLQFSWTLPILSNKKFFGSEILLSKEFIK